MCKITFETWGDMSGHDKVCMDNDIRGISVFIHIKARLIPYSGKFSWTINFTVFVDFTSTTKIISSKFLLEQAACLCDQINCFTCVSGNLIRYCTSTLQ